MLRILRKQKSHKVYVDGEWIPDLQVEARDSSKGKWYAISAATPEATKILSDLPLTTESIPDYLPHLRLRRVDGLDAPPWLTDVLVSRLETRVLITVLLSFSPETPGLVEHAGAFVAALGDIPELGIHSVDISTSLEVDARAQLTESVSTVTQAVALAEALLRPAFAVLARENVPSVDALFEFPASVRTACEQYLLHFAEFLRDLGVNTSVNLAETANQVLFTVTPVDRLEALENIRVALDAYLHLPGVILVDDPDNASDRITAYKLRANLSHLHAQLDLAHAQNEAMQAHVRTQNVLIELLHSGKLTPRQKVQSAESDSEVLLKYISLTDVEKGGIKVHLAALLRDLKKMFQKKSI